MSEETRETAGTPGSEEQTWHGKPMPRRRPPRFTRENAPRPGEAPSGEAGAPADAPGHGQAPQGMGPIPIPKEALGPHSSVKHVVGVVSGKGGVGKSSVTAILAVALSRKGYRVAVMDADMTGPSIPRMFGIRGNAVADERGILPRTSDGGVQVMSLNLLLEEEGDPVVWRGPVLGNVVKQFWSEVVWEDIDVMLVDMPPGTGDVPLTVYQSLPIDGVVIVTSPQSLVNMIVTKSVRMAEKMNVPVFGIVENMAYFRAPDTGKEYEVFGPSHIQEIASEHDLEVLAKLPIDPAFAAMSDRGEIEQAADELPGQKIDELGVTMMKKLHL